MRTFLLTVTVLLTGGLGQRVQAQITTLKEDISNSAVEAAMIRSNANSQAEANSKYLRLHPTEATNSLDAHQLWLLDVATGRIHPQYISPEESNEMRTISGFVLTNAASRSSYFFHIHGMSDREYQSNVVIAAVRNAAPPQPWPEPARRVEIFDHCATVLRFAIDTNQVEIACAKLTNQADVAILKRIATVSINSLNRWADILTNTNMISYLGSGFRAKLSTQTNTFYFGFWPGNGVAGIVVSEVEERTHDASHILVKARFNSEGKMLNLIKNGFDQKGNFETQIQLVFNNDGTLRSYWERALTHEN